jgi:hypothetical protein
MPVTAKDAQTVLKTILHTFAMYVCEGHESLAGEHMGQTVQCDGRCQWETARKTREAKSYADMDATPTLCDHKHENLSKGSWSIFWEGGNAPDEWVFSEQLAENVRKATEGRVFIEPINSCILGVFPA